MSPTGALKMETQTVLQLVSPTSAVIMCGKICPQQVALSGNGDSFRRWNLTTENKSLKRMMGFCPLPIRCVLHHSHLRLYRNIGARDCGPEREVFLPPVHCLRLCHRHRSLANTNGFSLSEEVECIVRDMTCR